jgi:hypothetical protein
MSNQETRPTYTWAELYTNSVRVEMAAELMRCSVAYAQERYRHEAKRVKRAKQQKRSTQRA